MSKKNKMKKLIVIFCLCYIAACNYKRPKESVTEIISNTDTITITGYFNTDVSKSSATEGANDTVANIFRIKFINSFRRDTVYVHDTIYTSKHYGNVGTVNIGRGNE